jgi:hypothetical protein
MLMTSERDDAEMYVGLRAADAGDDVGSANENDAVKLPVGGTVVVDTVEEPPPPPQPATATLAMSIITARRARGITSPESVKRTPRKGSPSFTIERWLTLRSNKGLRRPAG